MSKTDLLKDLLVTVECLKNELAVSNIKKVKIAQEAYHELLDDFYEEYRDIMARQLFEKARNDPDYFLVLIQLAYHYQDTIKVDNEGDQTLSYMNWKLFTQI
jgi:hypothetical protein